MNTSSKDVTLSLQNLGFDVMRIKQMKAAHASADGTIYFPLFLLNLAPR
jgi:hypothetical protein